MEDEVKFRKKSSWQEEDCINPNCQNESTIEAFYGKVETRCCEDEKCKIFAINLAKNAYPFSSSLFIEIGFSHLSLVR